MLLKNDEEAVKLIKKLISLEIEDEEEWSIALQELEQYVAGSAEVLIQSKKIPSPEEILKIAREKNKVIYL